MTIYSIIILNILVVMTGLEFKLDATFTKPNSFIIPFVFIEIL